MNKKAALRELRQVQLDWENKVASLKLDLASAQIKLNQVRADVRELEAQLFESWCSEDD